MKYSAGFIVAVFIAALGWGITGCATTNYQQGTRLYRPDNAAAALQELKPLAEQGDAEAQFKLGSLYYQGLGVPQDYPEAIKWLRRAADQRHVSAEVVLGNIYANGFQGAIAKDLPQALMWFIFAAAQGDPEALEHRDNLTRRLTPAQIVEAQRMAREYQPEYAYTKLIGQLTPLAEKGDSDAQFRLAVMYYHGRGVARDFTKALDLFKKAALQGHPLAQYNVGFMYEKGEGTAQDYAIAAKYYRQSAERGNLLAQYKLGSVYEKGQGVAPDEVQALMWYTLAAIRGDVTAKTARDRVTVWMTPQQVAEAQRLASEFKTVRK